MNEFEKKLVEALRSGKYKQGRSALHNKDKNTYCCLGVACDLEDSKRWFQEEGEEGYPFLSYGEKDIDYSDVALPDFLQEQYNWSSPTGTLSFSDREGDQFCLTDCNDSLALSFDNIADLIQAGLVLHATN